MKMIVYLISIFLIGHVCGFNELQIKRISNSWDNDRNCEPVGCFTYYLERPYLMRFWKRFSNTFDGDVGIVTNNEFYQRRELVANNSEGFNKKIVKRDVQSSKRFFNIDPSIFTEGEGSIVFGNGIKNFAIHQTRIFKSEPLDVILHNKRISNTFDGGVGKVINNELGKRAQNVKRISKKFDGDISNKRIVNNFLNADKLPEVINVTATFDTKNNGTTIIEQKKREANKVKRITNNFNGATIGQLTGTNTFGFVEPASVSSMSVSSNQADNKTISPNFVSSEILNSLVQNNFSVPSSVPSHTEQTFIINQ